VLTSIDLSQNQLCGIDRFGKGTYDPSGIQALAAAIGSGSAVLKKIVLSHNSIKDEGAIALGESLKTNKSLEELELYKCDISAIGGKAIGEALQLGIAVPTDCNLLHNNLDVESATMLAKIGTEKGIMLSGIKRHQTEADFSYHGLQSADGILIASDLRVSAVLKKLVLRSNSIQDEGAVAIGESLKTNSMLEELDLYNCGISADGGKAIGAGLQAGIAVFSHHTVCVGGDQVRGRGSRTPRFGHPLPYACARR